jgi:hypothetical protein
MIRQRYYYSLEALPANSRSSFVSGPVRRLTSARTGSLFGHDLSSETSETRPHLRLMVDLDLG